MEKRAQRRSLRSKVLETVHVPGRGAEALSPTFKAIMKEMRTTDEKIRKIADPVKVLIRQIRSNTRRRDYLEAAVYLADFHDRMRHIAHLLNKFLTSSPMIQREELLQKFKSPHKEKLFKYDPDSEIKEAAAKLDPIVKEAGPLEWMKDKFLDLSDLGSDTAHNLLTGKGWARRHMEKRFSDSIIREMRELTQELSAESNDLANTLLEVLDKMESGISRRNIDLYKSRAREFVDAFNNYHKKFQVYENKIMKPFKEQYAQMVKTQEEATKVQEETRRKEREDAFNKFYEQRQRQEQERLERERREEAEARKSPFVTPHVEQQPPRAPYTELTFDEWKKAYPPKPSSQEQKQVLDKLETEMGKVSHQEFLDKITALSSQEDMPNFIKELVNYSEQLEEIDQNASSDLLLLADEIVRDHKTAGIFDIFKGKPTAEQEAPIPTLKKKDKPQDLIQQREEFLKQKKIDLPEGRVDRAYTDIPFLAGVTPSKIRITPETGRYLVGAFGRRIANVLDIADLSPYIDALEKNLIPVLKQAIYDGWVLNADNVLDTHNPNDKYIEVYTRLNLSDVIPDLNGTAKLHVSCRLSANQGTVTVRGVKKHFEIDVNTPEETPVEKAQEDTDDDQGDTDLGHHDDHLSQYDDSDY